MFSEQNLLSKPGSFVWHYLSILNLFFIPKIGSLGLMLYSSLSFMTRCPMSSFSYWFLSFFITSGIIFLKVYLFICWSGRRSLIHRCLQMAPKTPEFFRTCSFTFFTSFSSGLESWEFKRFLFDIVGVVFIINKIK